MTRRQQLIDTIQSLSAEEGTRQPTAANWLKSQDDQVAVKALAADNNHDEDTSDDANSGEH